MDHGSVLEEKSCLKMLGLTLSYWVSYIITIAKTASQKIGDLIRSMKFLSPEVALYLYKSTIRSCKEYCCHVWAGTPNYYFEMFDKLQKQICCIFREVYLIFVSPFLDVIMMSMSTVSFLAKLDSGIHYLWNTFLWPMIYMALHLGLGDTFYLKALSKHISCTL